MIYQYGSYKTFLRDELAQRVSRNPSYSMRAMATQLEIGQSFLTEILNGKKNLSLDAAMTVAQRLGLDSRQTEYFCLLVQLEATKNPAVKAVLLERVQALQPKRKIHDLSVDLFRSISDWYHFAIRELTSVEGFEFSPKAVARRLGITSIEASAAIDRLERIELIEKSGSSYRKTQDTVHVTSPVSNAAIRNYHRQVLSKASESLEIQPPTERITHSEVLAVAPAQLDEARKITQDYVSRMTALSSAPVPKTDVYQLGIQFFSLTQKSKKE